MSYLFSSHPAANQVSLSYIFFASFLLACSVEERGNVASLGHGKSWQECFLSILTFVLEIFCPKSPGGQAECLLEPPEFVSPIKNWDHCWNPGAQAATVTPRLQFECWCTFLGQDLILQRLEERSEVITAGCIAKQALTFHKPQSCISS